MKIALVHDYLSQDGGAEYVLDVLRGMWPEAPVFVLFRDKEKFSRYDSVDVRESFLRYMPSVKKHYQWYLPLMPLATERHDLRDFDVVLSNTSAFAKGIITQPNTLHLSYCHTPTRYLWTDTHEYVSDLPYPSLVKMFLPPLLHRLRLWDMMSAERVDKFIANSRTVEQRILKYYRRESVVVHPPVSIGAFRPKSDIGDYFFTGGRLVPYKRFDIAIHAANRLRVPLYIFGEGPSLSRLRSYAGPTIKFLGRISDEEKAEYMSRARAFIHPQMEDFGITPVESMASGRPVIAFGAGGVTESVIPGKTGVFFFEQSWEPLYDIMANFDDTAWNADVLLMHAKQFGPDIFAQRMRDIVHAEYDAFSRALLQCKLPARAVSDKV